MKFSVKSSSFKYIAISISIAAISSLVLFVFFFTPYKVTGVSMLPVVKNGEKILISKPFISGKIKRFDIVVAKLKRSERKRILKRVIGLPGEYIEIRNGNVMIDNSPLDEPFLINKGDVIFRSINMKLKFIPNDNYFLMGDNRENSSDSRELGPFHKDMIVGKPIFRYWPLKRSGFIK